MSSHSIDTEIVLNTAMRRLADLNSLQEFFDNKISFSKTFEKREALKYVITFYRYRNCPRHC